MLHRYKVVQATHGEQALGEGIGCGHTLRYWEIAILLCPSCLDGYRGKHWGEVFQQPAKGFAYEAVYFTHFLSCLHVCSWLPGLILSSTQPLRKSPPIHIRYTLWRSR
jgi:hypothetical protein